MGSLIWAKVTEQGISVNKQFFVFGGIAPDLWISCVYRPHFRRLCAGRFYRLLRRLYSTGGMVGGLPYSFFLGVMTHYLCDFLCYAHTPAFKGGLREHMQYEKKQKVESANVLPLLVQKGKDIHYNQLINTLDDFITKRETYLMWGDESPDAEISIAINMAAWAVTCVYGHAEKASSLNAEERRNTAGDPVIRAG